MSRSWAGGSTRGWRKLRLRILERDHWVCQVKLAGICTGKATVVHHTQGKAVTGDDPNYLVASCHDCNQEIGEPTRDPQPETDTEW